MLESMSAAPPISKLGPEVIELMSRGVALVVGSASDGLLPEVCRGWGPRWVAQSGELQVLIPMPAGARTVSNLERAPALAFTFSMPTDYTCFQLKGRRVDVREPRAEDWRRARGHFDAFLAELPRVGLDPTTFASWFPAAGRLLTARIEVGFSQAPGARAGLPL